MKKLDDKGEKCVFLGVSEASKAYKLFNPLTKKIVTSRDVIFDEESTWNWNGQQPTQVIFDNDAEEERQQLLQQQIPTVSIPESPPNDAPTAAETSSTTAESNVVAESRLRRVRKRPAWMQDFEVTGVQFDNYDTIAHYALLSDCDPITFQEAIKDLKCWELVELPKGQKSIGVKWVYKTKLNKDGGVDTYKARLVAKGTSKNSEWIIKRCLLQVAKLDTIRLVLSMAAQTHGLSIELEEEVYIDQPRYAKQGYENQVVQSSAGVFISQKKYALEILDKFIEVGPKLSKSGAGKRVDSTIYKRIVGSLMYPTSTRPDIISSFDRKKNFSLFERALRSGVYVEFGAITWSSKKQQIVTLSTMEAEFVLCSIKLMSSYLVRRLLEVLYNQQQGPTVISCDNLFAIKLSKNLVLHGRSKHIDVRYHFLRDLCKDGVIDLVFCKSEDQIADILTKPSSSCFMKFQVCLEFVLQRRLWSLGKALQIDS
ncbi:hypothetical protein AAG906_029299 [Vitis piasezkii]